MAYTWEEVILGIDVKHEMDEKERQQEEIEAAAKKEGDLQAAWSLGLSVLGGALFGPAGFFIGKQLGKWGVALDQAWESMTIDEGKFFSQDAKEFNKDLKKKAKDIDQAQLLDSVIDLGTMWIQAGGLQEGFDPTIGGGDWTIFGTGDSAWTLRGRKGDPGSLIFPGGGAQGPPELVGATPGIQGLFSSDKPGIMNALQAGGKRALGAYGQEQQVRQVASGAKTLDKMYQEHLEG